MTALDRQFVRLRFAALTIPFGLLFWLPSASVPVTILLAALLAAYNGVATLAIQKKSIPRFTRPMAVLLLVLDHAVISAWILLFATPTSSLPYLLYALVAAEAVRVVRESGLPNQTDAMFTTIEGDWDETMAVIKQAVDAVAARAPRVSLVLKADIRPGVTGALTAKVEAVERYLDG